MMAATDDPYTEAKGIIGTAQLSPNDQSLLSRFVGQSHTPKDAATYVLERIPQSSSRKSTEDTLLSIKEDLKILAVKANHDANVPQEPESAVREREKGRCFVTGEADYAQATWIVSPSLLDDDALRSGGSLRSLLEAFISTKLLSQLEAFIQSRRKEDSLKNLLLLSPSARQAFRNGQIEITRSPFYGAYDFDSEEKSPGPKWQTGMTEPGGVVLDTARFHPLTPDNDRLPLPKRSLLRIHYLLSLPLHFLAIERQINNGWPPIKQKFTALGPAGIFIIRGLLRITPACIRLTLYKYILKTVSPCGPRNLGPCEIRLLPLGLCLKQGRPGTTRNEVNALSLVEKHTTVPAPKLVDFVMQEKEEKDEEIGFILMTQAPGDRLDEVLYLMTSEERKQLGRDLGKCISQYRHIPNTTSHQIANTLSGPAFDHIFQNNKECGPFNSEADFTDSLTEGIWLEKERQNPPLNALYKPHKTVFTHSDLHHSNIFVSRGQLSCIVDWEHAGFKPEYWEYTRGLRAYCARMRVEKGILDEAFKEDYAEELEGQKMLWMAFPVM